MLRRVVSAREASRSCLFVQGLCVEKLGAFQAPAAPVSGVFVGLFYPLQDRTNLLHLLWWAFSWEVAPLWVGSVGNVWIRQHELKLVEHVIKRFFCCWLFFLGIPKI